MIRRTPLRAGLVAVLLLSPLGGCADDAVTRPDPFKQRAIPTELEADVHDAVAGNAEFAFDLYRRLAAESRQNLVLSPHSISAALAMTWAGARNTTEEEMAAVLHFTLGQNRTHPAFGALDRSLEAGAELGGYRLDLANRLWGLVDYPWLPEFVRITNEHYGAELEEMDFQHDPEGSRSRINSWVRGKTQDRIPHLLPPGSVTTLTALVLTNAVYFKGTWETAFDSRRTAEGDFHTGSGAVVRVPMMSADEYFPYFQDEGAQVLELPYTGRDLGMVLILPRDPADFAALESDLAPERVDAWLAGLSATRLSVRLPRFRIESGFELNGMLAEMGMPSAFELADFSGMNGERDLSISLVVHRGFVEVNEEGTEAAGSTGVVIIRESAGPEFRADRPFLFLIRDHVTGAVLFLGRVLEL